MTMTTKNGVEIICKDVNELLEDICSFLTQEINKGNLSNNSKANKLIERSKSQLQIISKLNIEAYDEPYVDMQGKKDDVGIVEDDLFYDQIKDEIKPEKIKMEFTDEIQCPFANLPAKSLTGDKCGNIMLKTKFVFNFVEKNKQMYAGIHKNWFLIYYTEKDNKPYQTINLNEYTIKMDKQQIEQHKHIFELSNNKKSYHFTAITYKDLWQWITAIKKNSNQFFYNEEQSKQKGFNVKTNSFDTCDDDDDDDEIYQTILEPSGVKIMNINNKRNTSLPLLPERTYKPKKSLPEDEIISDSDSDEIYNEVAYPPKPINNINNSKIEDDEDDGDEIYNVVNDASVSDQPEEDEVYNFVNNSYVPQNIKQEDEEDEIYNLVDDNNSMVQKTKQEEEDEEEIYNIVDDNSMSEKIQEEEDEIYNLVDDNNSMVQKTKQEEEDEEEIYNIVDDNSMSEKIQEDEDEIYNLVQTSSVSQNSQQNNDNSIVSSKRETFTTIQRSLKKKIITKPIVPPKVRPKPDIKTISDNSNMQFTKNSSFLSRHSANKIKMYGNNTN